MKQRLGKVEIIALISGILQLIVASLPWFGILPPSKPVGIFNNIFNFLFLGFPLIWTIFSISVTFFIVHFLIRRSTQANQNKNLDPNEIEVYVRSEGEQIRFFIDSGVTKLRIWLRIINKSSAVINLDKITWQFYLNQFHKGETKVLSGSMREHETKDSVLVEVALNDAESKLLNEIGDDITRTHFSGSLFFNVNGKSFQRDFNYQQVHCSVDVHLIKKPFKVSSDHEWALIRLLSQTNRASNRGVLLKIYQILGKETADFNVLESELQKADLISIGNNMEGKYWVLTKHGLDIAGNLHKSKNRSAG